MRAFIAKLYLEEPFGIVQVVNLIFNFYPKEKGIS